MRKNAKQKLIDFMYYKNKLIQNFLDIESEYFNKDDENVIRNWSDKTCKRIVRDIKNNFDDSGYCDAQICPFCILHISPMGCDACEYIKFHGNCNDDDSTYDTIDFYFKDKYGFDNFNGPIRSIIIKTKSKKKLLDILNRGLQNEE